LCVPSGGATCACRRAVVLYYWSAGCPTSSEGEGEGDGTVSPPLEEFNAFRA
jgi:hypothetical protein